jgi:hypothetical protein
LRELRDDCFERDAFQRRAGCRFFDGVHEVILQGISRRLAFTMQSFFTFFFRT